MADVGELSVLIGKLEEGIQKIDHIACTQINGTSAFQQAVCDEFIKLVNLFENHEFVEIIEKFSSSNDANEEEILNEFRDLPDGERTAIIKIMETVWRFGLACGEEDTEKRRHWYEKVKNA
jgi:hypothetical protein